MSYNLRGFDATSNNALSVIVKLLIISLNMCRCLVSQKPRSFDATRSVVLGNMAELLVRQLEYKWAESEARQSNVQLMRSLACYEEAFLFLDTSKAGDWRLHMNMAACKLLGELLHFPSLLLVGIVKSKQSYDQQQCAVHALISLL